MDLLWLQGDCARPAGCAFPNALAGRALAQDSTLFRKRKENCFFARLQPGDCARPAGCAFPNALAGRALAQDSSLFRKRKENCFFAPFLTSKLDGRGQKNSLSHLRQAAVLCGERGIRTPGTETRTAV